MSVKTGKSKSRMKRAQIRMLPEEYELARRIAAARGISLSRLFRDALHVVDTDEPLGDPLGHLIGMVKDGEPTASELHDEIYDSDFR